jgi:hypothetical protein
MSVKQRGVRGLTSWFALFAAVLGVLFTSSAVLSAGVVAQSLADQEKDKKDEK